MSEGQSAHEENVPAHTSEATPRYIFHHGGDTSKEVLPASGVYLHKKTSAKGCAVFSPHTQNKLRAKQELSHLDTFCKDSYLHAEKTAH